MTVAFEIKLPWRSNRTAFSPRGSRSTLITIWHVDPCTNGTDDSCGWHYPPLSAEDRALAREMASWEQQQPYYFNALQRAANPEYPNLWKVSPGDAAALVLVVWNYVARRRYRRDLTPELATQALLAGVNEGDNFAGSLTASTPAEQERALGFIIRAYRRATRPWYRQPKWHVRHWRLQIHPLQAFKRWAFTRCHACGRRFQWGESGVGTWSGDGPRWFRSEQLTHMRCSSAQPIGS